MRPHAPSLAASRPSERGAALVIAVLSLVVLLGVSAFVVDVGHAYYVHRSLQADADAAALAGAQGLPNATNATTIAQTYGGESGGRNVRDNISGVTQTV